MFGRIRYWGECSKRLRRPEITRSRQGNSLSEDPRKRKPAGKHGPRHHASDIEPAAAVQEEQKRQHGSARQQDFQHEIRAQRLSQSTQHPQTARDDGHSRLRHFRTAPNPRGLHQLIERGSAKSTHLLAVLCAAGSLVNVGCLARPIQARGASVRPPRSVVPRRTRSSPPGSSRPPGSLPEDPWPR